MPTSVSTVETATSRPLDPAPPSPSMPAAGSVKIAMRAATGQSGRYDARMQPG